MIEVYLELELIVDYDYQPEEPMVRYYPDGSGYPGAAEEVTVTSVKFGNVELISELSDEQIEEIEEQILENI